MVSLGGWAQILEGSDLRQTESRHPRHLRRDARALRSTRSCRGRHARDPRGSHALSGGACSVPRSICASAGPKQLLEHTLEPSAANLLRTACPRYALRTPSAPPPRCRRGSGREASAAAPAAASGELRAHRQQRASANYSMPVLRPCREDPRLTLTSNLCSGLH